MFPPEIKIISSRDKKCSLPRKQKSLPLILYLIIYERVKNVAHLKKDA